MMQRANTQIKSAYKSRVDSDAGSYPNHQCSYLGKTSNYTEIYPYGVAGNAPLDSRITLFNLNGQEENKAGITQAQHLRPKNLKAGEVAFSNFFTGTIIKMLENGDIEVIGQNDVNVTVSGAVNLTVTGDTTLNVTGNTTITSPQVTINGDLTVNGDIDTPSGEVSASGINLSTHVHSGVTSGGSNTGGPV